MKYSLITMFTLLICCSVYAQKDDMIIRISEIQIDSNYLEQYKAILKEESSASVKLEPGVISIYPMYQKEQRTQVRILEIYASKEAYQSHLKTPHFQKYKTTTLNMVKSLKFIDMDAIDPEHMPKIFRKLKDIRSGKEM
jgi:quinol monooxygenase YgiN